MTRTTTPIAVALTATAALLLTACSGSSDDSSDQIAGAGSTASKSASPSASAASNVKRPTITLPKDLTLTFSPESVGDPVKDAVLADNAELLRGIDAAIAEGNPKYAAIKAYTEGDAAVDTHDWIKSFTDADWSITGTMRYFDRKVTIKSSDEALLVYCADESKGYSKVNKTGEIKKTPTTKKSYVLYSTILGKDKQGIWQTVKVVSQRGAEGCRP